jgi:hypothetical protein
MKRIIHYGGLGQHWLGLFQWHHSDLISGTPQIVVALLVLLRRISMMQGRSPWAMHSYNPCFTLEITFQLLFFKIFSLF